MEIVNIKHFHYLTKLVVERENVVTILHGAFSIRANGRFGHAILESRKFMKNSLVQGFCSLE
jgi:hypothetical protein